MIILISEELNRPLTIWTSTKLGRRISFSVASGQDRSSTETRTFIHQVKQVERQTRYSTELCNLPARLTYLATTKTLFPCRRENWDRVQVPPDFQIPLSIRAWRCLEIPKLSQGDPASKSSNERQDKFDGPEQGCLADLMMRQTLPKINKSHCPQHLRIAVGTRIRSPTINALGPRF